MQEFTSHFIHGPLNIFLDLVRGFNSPYKLETWEDISFEKDDIKLNITATPGRHGRFPAAIFVQVMGSILDFQTINDEHLLRLYITGDTLVFDDIKEIPKRYPDVDVALLHLRGTTVMGIMLTMDGKEGVDMFHIISPRKVIPIHYNDYDVFKSPLEEFKQQLPEIFLPWIQWKIRFVVVEKLELNFFVAWTIE